LAVQEEDDPLGCWEESEERSSTELINVSEEQSGVRSQGEIVPVQEECLPVGVVDMSIEEHASRLFSLPPKDRASHLESLSVEVRGALVHQVRLNGTTAAELSLTEQIMVPNEIASLKSEPRERAQILNRLDRLTEEAADAEVLQSRIVGLNMEINSLKKQLESCQNQPPESESVEKNELLARIYTLKELLSSNRCDDKGCVAERNYHLGCINMLKEEVRISELALSQMKPQPSQNINICEPNEVEGKDDFVNQLLRCNEELKKEVVSLNKQLVPGLSIRDEDRFAEREEELLNRIDTLKKVNSVNAKLAATPKTDEDFEEMFLMERLEAFRLEVGTLKAEVKDLSSGTDEWAAKKIKSLESDIAGQHEAFQNLLTLHSTIEEKYEALKAEGEDDELMHIKSMNISGDTYQSLSAAQVAEDRAVEKMDEETLKKVQELEDALHKSQAKMELDIEEKVGAKVQELEAELHDSRAKMKLDFEEKLGALQAGIRHLKAELKQKKDAIAIAQTANRALQFELEKKQSQLREVNEELDATKSVLKTTQTELNSFEPVLPERQDAAYSLFTPPSRDGERGKSELYQKKLSGTLRELHSTKKKLDVTLMEMQELRNQASDATQSLELVTAVIGTVDGEKNEAKREITDLKHALVEEMLSKKSSSSAPVKKKNSPTQTFPAAVIHDISTKSVRWSELPVTARERLAEIRNAKRRLKADLFSQGYVVVNDEIEKTEEDIVSIHPSDFDWHDSVKHRNKINHHNRVCERVDRTSGTLNEDTKQLSWTSRAREHLIEMEMYNSQKAKEAEEERSAFISMSAFAVEPKARMYNKNKAAEDALAMLNDTRVVAPSIVDVARKPRKEASIYDGIFDSVDTNSDGIIDGDEFSAYSASPAAYWRLAGS